MIPPGARGLPGRLVLLLTGRCNLTCAYCYQDHRRTRDTMPWEVAWRALDLVLGAAGERARIVLGGGEPLLAPELVRRCIRSVREDPRGRRSTLVLSTNGTLLTPELTGFLAAHHVELNLSFDGVAAAQAARGAWTFPALRRVLDELASAHPAYTARQVHVGLTLTSANVPLLAASVELLMGWPVARIHVTPSILPDPAWGPAADAVLQDQAARIVQRSLERWRETDRVPVAFLAAGIGEPHRAPPGVPCGAAAGELLCVDPGGRPWTCPALAGSMRRLPVLVREARGALDLGERLDPGLAERLRNLPARARATALFVMPGQRISSRGPCAGCTERDSCHVCPAALDPPAHPGEAPAVPALHCGFNRATTRARRRFQELRRIETLGRSLDRLIRPANG